MDSTETTTTKSSSKNNKISKRRRFLMCFRPAKIDGFVRPRGGINGSEEDDEFFKYMSIGKKESAVFPEFSPTSSSSDDDQEDEEECGTGPRSKRFGSRRISRALKAVLCDASLTKSHGKKKLFPQKSSNSLMSDFYSRDYETSDRSRMISRVPSSLSVSSAAVFIAPTMCGSCGSQLPSSAAVNNNNNNNNNNSNNINMNSRNITSERIRSFGSNSFVWRQTNDDINNNNAEAAEEKKLCYASDRGLCLMGLSLFVLITWGKICAIFCTSTWLFFIPFWAGRQVRGLEKPLEMDSAESRKRVVMEGFLARDRAVIDRAGQ